MQWDRDRLALHASTPDPQKSEEFDVELAVYISEAKGRHVACNSYPIFV